jgi:hypothetical protein
MELDGLQPGFTYLLLEQVNPEKNEQRFYYLAWQPTLFEHGAILRIYGRKGGQRQIMSPLPYPALAEAWPLIRKIIRRRLQHGYHITEPQGAAQLSRQDSFTDPAP